MKKKISVLLILLLVLTMVVPTNVFAKDGNTVPQTFAEAAKEEEIDFNHSNYKSDSSKAKVYLFRGHQCKYCYNLLKFLESIVNDYGKYFDLVSYEVWNDDDNYKLMKTVASVFGEDANGVPYLVIGDKTFIGYTSSYDDSIKKEIKSLYNSTSRYDVMEHLDEAKLDEDSDEKQNEDTKDSKKTATNSSSYSSEVVIYTVAIATFALGVLYVVKSNVDNKRLENSINELKNKIASLENDTQKNNVSVIKEEKKETKNDKKSNKRGRKKKEVKE